MTNTLTTTGATRSATGKAPMPGDKVRGTYIHSPFAGTVRSRRGHTINWAVTEFAIDLDEPVYIAIIDRTEERSLLIYASHDGTTLPSSAGDWGDTGDYVEVVA